MFVTWDEAEIVAAMVKALSDAIGSSTDAGLTAAERKFISCVNEGRGTDDQYDSVGDILADYTGELRDKVDTCDATHGLFEAMERVAGIELARLKSSNALYRDLLATDEGRLFETQLSEPNVAKQYIYLLATRILQSPGELTAPYYEEGVSGQADEQPPQVTRQLGTGKGCLPEGVDGTRLQLLSKVAVLNCLVFATPHSFWVEQARADNKNTLKDDERFNWLGFEKWDCTWSPDYPLAACLKHDVAYASLQKFSGSTVGQENSNELDTAWNPRNKHLADAMFFDDILEQGCSAKPLTSAYSEWCSLAALEQASIMHWFVNKWNSKTWPVTEEDIAHTVKYGRFGVCQVPDAVVESLTRKDRTIIANLNYSPGCVSGITPDYYRLCWSVDGNQRISHRTHNRREIRDTCTRSEGDVPNATYTLSRTAVWDSVTLVSIEIRPNNIAYGGPWGFETLLGNRWFDNFTQGAYYPKRKVNLAIYSDP